MLIDETDAMQVSLVMIFYLVANFTISLPIFAIGYLYNRTRNSHSPSLTWIIYLLNIYI